MMGVLRAWLLGIACAAMLLALAQAMTPAGTVRKVGQFMGGLVLLLMVVKPVLHMDFSSLARSVQENWAAPQEIEAMANVNQSLLKTIIAERTGAYILDKAQALGVPCAAATVTCTAGEDGMPYPTTVTLDAPYSAALARAIEAELAIPADHQTYQTGGEAP